VKAKGMLDASALAIGGGNGDSNTAHSLSNTPRPNTPFTSNSSHPELIPAVSSGSVQYTGSETSGSQVSTQVGPFAGPQIGPITKITTALQKQWRKAIAKDGQKASPLRHLRRQLIRLNKMLKSMKKEKLNEFGDQGSKRAEEWDLNERENEESDWGFFSEIPSAVSEISLLMSNSGSIQKLGSSDEWEVDGVVYTPEKLVSEMGDQRLLWPFGLQVLREQRGEVEK
jgi:hypothetical protein